MNHKSNKEKKKDSAFIKNFKSFMNTCLSRNQDMEIQLRKTYYFKLSAAALLMLVIGIASLISIQSITMMLLSIALFIGLFIYQLYCEEQFANGTYHYALMVCDSENTKTGALQQKVSGNKTVYEYTFVPFESDDIGFVLNRTKAAGFYEGSTYLFAYNGEMCNDNSMIAYLKIDVAKRKASAKQNKVDAQIDSVP